MTFKLFKTYYSITHDRLPNRRLTAKGYHAMDVYEGRSAMLTSKPVYWFTVLKYHEGDNKESRMKALFGSWFEAEEYDRYNRGGKKA